MSAIKEQSDLAQKNADLCNRVFNEDEFCTEEDWIDIQTLCAIAIELIKSSSPSKLREAARTVEIRHRTKFLRSSNQYEKINTKN